VKLWDGVELTFDNVVNDSSLYGSDVLNRIEKKSVRFGKSNPNIFFLYRNALLSGEKSWRDNYSFWHSTWTRWMYRLTDKHRRTSSAALTHCIAIIWPVVLVNFWLINCVFWPNDIQAIQEKTSLVNLVHYISLNFRPLSVHVWCQVGTLLIGILDCYRSAVVGQDNDSRLLEILQEDSQFCSCLIIWTTVAQTYVTFANKRICHWRVFDPAPFRRKNDTYLWRVCWMHLWWNCVWIDGNLINMDLLVILDVFWL